jgi:hypothetical protein
VKEKTDGKWREITIGRAIEFEWERIMDKEVTSIIFEYPLETSC